MNKKKTEKKTNYTPLSRDYWNLNKIYGGKERKE
jgi:hypothetical protein